MIEKNHILARVARGFKVRTWRGDMYGRILVPVDGSETSERGLEEGLGLAAKLAARVRIMHVVNKTPWVPPESSPELTNQLLDQLRGSGESIVHDALTTARAAGVEADTRIIEALGAEAGECIVQEACSWPADLIVCGTHGRRGVRRFLIGSDAEYVLRRSPVPVLLVRLAAADRSGTSSGLHECVHPSGRT